MCGLIGFSGKNPVNPYKLKTLILYSRDRGKDGVGLGYRNPEKNNKYFFIKQNKDPRKVVPTLSVPKVNTIIGHVRNSSLGTIKTEEGLHPFMGFPYYGTHNGFLGNYIQVAKEHDVDDNVDSETFYQILGKTGDIKETCAKFTGTAAFAYLDKDGNLYLLRFNKPLFYGYDGNGDLWYASEKKFLDGIGLHVIEMCEEGTLYKIKDSEIVETQKGLELKKVSIHVVGFNRDRKPNTYSVNHYVMPKEAPKEAKISVTPSGHLKYFWEEEETVVVEEIGVYGIGHVNHYLQTDERDLKLLNRDHPEIYKHFTEKLLNNG